MPLVQLDVNVGILVDNILHPSGRTWTNQLPVVSSQLMSTWSLQRERNASMGNNTRINWRKWPDKQRTCTYSTYQRLALSRDDPVPNQCTSISHSNIPRISSTRFSLKTSVSFLVLRAICSIPGLVLYNQLDIPFSPQAPPLVSHRQ